jgi:hypothetical protein
MKSAFAGFDERLRLINTVIKPGFATARAISDAVVPAGLLGGPAVGLNAKNYPERAWLSLPPHLHQTLGRPCTWPERFGKMGAGHCSKSGACERG